MVWRGRREYTAGTVGKNRQRGGGGGGSSMYTGKHIRRVAEQHGWGAEW